MAFVYLIGKIDDDNTCKIGVTKNKVLNRLNEIQTGSSDELYIKQTFETDYPFKLEKMLHKHFNDKKIMNEWFYLSNEDISNFKNICQIYNNNFEILKNNPFFK